MSTPSGVAGGGKLCSVCGEDVSARPRTKDKHGRYFCTPCYERAIAAKHAKHEAARHRARPNHELSRNPPNRRLTNQTSSKACSISKARPRLRR
jgi:hypothetical protein